MLEEQEEDLTISLVLVVEQVVAVDQLVKRETVVLEEQEEQEVLMDLLDLLDLLEQQEQIQLLVGLVEEQPEVQEPLD